MFLFIFKSIAKINLILILLLIFFFLEEHYADSGFVHDTTFIKNK